VPFKLEGGDRIDDTPVHKALREALANCLINADYYGRQGLVIVKRKDSITLSNPGGFRIDVEAAVSGGVSDPRNSALIKMFNLVDIGERAGSGIPNIYNVWNKQGWPAPIIEESFEPERIKVSLMIGKSDDKKVTVKSDDKKISAKFRVQTQAIINYLTMNVYAKNSDIANLLGVKSTRVKQIMKALVEAEIVVAEGENKERVYKLK